MPDPPVTPEIHQSFDIHRNFPAQVPFVHALGDFTPKRIELRIGQVTNGHVRADPGRFAYSERPRPADSVDMRQGDPYVLPIGDIDSGDTCHNGLLSLSGQGSARVSARISAQPCLCLCRASLQMTRTVPLRRITLQFRHSRLTDARTFIGNPLPASSRYTCSTISLQVGFLQQSFVLVRHHVRLHLRHEIHRHDNNDEE